MSDQINDKINDQISDNIEEYGKLRWKKRNTATQKEQ